MFFDGNHVGIEPVVGFVRDLDVWNQSMNCCLHKIEMFTNSSFWIPGKIEVEGLEFALFVEVYFQLWFWMSAPWPSDRLQILRDGFDSQLDRIWHIHRTAADSKSASSLRTLPQLLFNFRFTILWKWNQKNQIFHILAALRRSVQRVAASISKAQRLGDTVPIWPARQSNPRPRAPISMRFTTEAAGCLTPVVVITFVLLVWWVGGCCNRWSASNCQRSTRLSSFRSNQRVLERFARESIRQVSWTMDILQVDAWMFYTRFW